MKQLEIHNYLTIQQYQITESLCNYQQYSNFWFNTEIFETTGWIRLFEAMHANTLVRRKPTVSSMTTKHIMRLPVNPVTIFFYNKLFQIQVKKKGLYMHDKLRCHGLTILKWMLTTT